MQNSSKKHDTVRNYSSFPNCFLSHWIWPSSTVAKSIFSSFSSPARMSKEATLRAQAASAHSY